MKIKPCKEAILNLTLTSVVFEFSGHNYLLLLAGYLTLTSVVFE